MPRTIVKQEHPAAFAPVYGVVLPQRRAPSSTPVDPDVRNHVCRQCGRAFKANGHLQRHIRTHTGERNHVCPFPGCMTRCSRRDNLQQHFKIHVQGSKRPNKKGRAFSKSSGSAAPLSPPALVPAEILDDARGALDAFASSPSSIYPTWDSDRSSLSSSPDGTPSPTLGQYTRGAVSSSSLEAQVTAYNLESRRLSFRNATQSNPLPSPLQLPLSSDFRSCSSEYSYYSDSNAPSPGSLSTSSCQSVQTPPPVVHYEEPYYYQKDVASDYVTGYHYQHSPTYTHGPCGDAYGPYHQAIVNPSS